MASRASFRGMISLGWIESSYLYGYRTASVVISRSAISNTNTPFHLSAKQYFRKYTSAKVLDETYHQRQGFGIVAAVSKDGVIGLNGKLPWSIPRDRAKFEHLTRGKVLIIGRHTLDEDPSWNHIAHAHTCIVVSRTANQSNFTRNTNVKVARSFDEALVLANDLSAKIKDKDRYYATLDQSGNDDGIFCWVGGGEKIYEEALHHPCASVLHLTNVDISIEDSLYEGSNQDRVSRFPDRNTWIHQYRKVSSYVDGVCTFCVYKKDS